ncbi:hypothetical protein [Candidatus Macondimonas diazotrophica]|uniref:3'-5' exonuclease domain-containing protein n=1 Tax=Candidatus Macondimonas diazotrophica TaxID=2305248 RepID=A0A4Z0F5H2_9GAMM|nr:hypothetical protein [Candidatus Macondimonas diazotrophica]TFZ81430.1 hypothetical protein E4680_12505 [Candidatus Macondimonas diazotrophica]
MIEVKYKAYSTRYKIRKTLKKLEDMPILGFDTETRGIYTKSERSIAKKLIGSKELSNRDRKLYVQIANNSGLSSPPLIQTTHFIFGLSDRESVVLVCEDENTEVFIWEWVSKYKGKLIIHNALFDLKTMFHRVKKLPADYEDTKLLAKSLINHAETYKARCDLKTLVGEYYPPSWSLFDSYEPDNLKEPKFLEYAAIDGCAVVLLWDLIQKELKNDQTY